MIMTALKYLVLSLSLAFSQEIQPFPKVGPIVRDITSDSITLMGQGSKHENVQGIYRVAQLTDSATSLTFSDPETFLMSQQDRNVGHAFLRNLSPATSYQIQIGYVPETGNLSTLDWNNAHQLIITTNATPQADDFSFIAGSCRRLEEILGISLWGKKGDTIFQAIIKDIQITARAGGKTNLIAFIGDQIYADATPFGKCTTFKEYAKRYELAFSQPFMRHLITLGIPVYMMRDDHEWWNNSNRETQQLKPDQDDAAARAYNLFQRPQGPETPNWWYSTSGDVDIFFLDIRSEREPSRNITISDEQMSALKSWLSREDLKDRIKVIASPVPMFLLDSSDSWGGYKEQLADLLTYITANNIKYTVVLSGDAHCENDAMFEIFDNEKDKKGHILEVLVSGLFAVSHGKADKLRNHMDLSDHGFIVEATEPLQPTLTKNLFARISGNHLNKTIDIWVYDNKNNLLKESHYDLERGLKLTS